MGGRDPSPDPGPDPEAVKDRAIKLAKGSFLLLKLFLQRLEQAPTDDSFYTTLEETPPEPWDPCEATIRDSTAKFGLIPGRIRCRKEILLHLVGTQAPITRKEISNAMSLRGDAEEAILTLCGQLVTWAGDVLQFSHHTVKEFLLDDSRLPLAAQDTILLNESDSHAFLAHKCLVCLMDNQYGSRRRIAQLLRGNFNEPTLAIGTFPTRNAMSYEYAARHWAFHLSKVDYPEPDLLAKVDKLLQTPQSVHWGEFAFRLARGDQNGGGNLSIVRNAYEDLHQWFVNLPDESQSRIRIDDYFICPYAEISKAYLTPPEEDKVLPWMPLIRLGDYCWELNLLDEGIKFRHQARDGLIQTLGPRHPLTL